MAITSLVLACLGFFTCGITSLFGLVFGIIAMVKVKGSGGTLKGDGMALSGIIVSAAFLLMIPIFAALLLPVLAAAKDRAQEINCISNEHQLVIATMIYTDNHAGHLPPAATWCDAIQSFVTTNAFRCAAAKTSHECDYAFNANLSGLDSSKISPQTVMIFESDAGWNASGGPELLASPARHRHGHDTTVAFADGSVREISQSELGTLRWNP
jgi:prepilin-type processing-associated H-X9-DG protein